MKKRLEAELISIAHRVLKLKNKSEVDQLFTETQKLYEALSVLKFYGDYIEHSEPEISQEDLDEKIADSLEGKKAPNLEVEVQQQIAKEKKQTVEVDEESAPDPIVEETPIIVGEINVEDDDDDAEEEITTAEKANEAPEETHFDPIFEMASEAPLEEKEAQKETAAEETTRGEGELNEVKPSPKQISFEDFLGDYKEVEFVKPNDTSKPTPPKEEPKEAPVEEPKEEPAVEEPTPKTPEKTAENKSVPGEKPAINIGLNDRVGFVKYLFDNSSEDFNRVLSQLNTFDSLSEAREFISDMVKPDYNNWKGNEDYEERFMEIVAQKFK